MAIKKMSRKEAIELIESLPDPFEHDTTGGIRPADYEETMKKWEESRKKREALMSKYPLLYGDRKKPMTQTAMCWGLDVNDGWLPLIDRLSAKLEKEIQTYLDSHPTHNCECGHEKVKHTYYTGGDLFPNILKGESCNHHFKMPFFSLAGIRSYMVPKNPIKRFFQKIYKGFIYKIRSVVYRTFSWLADNTFIYKEKKCYCKGYYPYHPKASQVKEKYGGLRFYMTCSTDAMNKMISEAEEEASKTCESCGQPGELCSDYGWYATMCKTCMNKRNQDDGREYQVVSDIKEEDDEKENS